MIHAVVFPSALPDRAKLCAEKWIAKGYKPLVCVDRGVRFRMKDVIVVEWPEVPFPGYYRTANSLVKAMVGDAEVITAIGDDMEPPDQGAEYVAKAYLERFPTGLGVMQPCGDPQGADEHGVPAAARICGSPVMGSEWVRRAYMGHGPFHDGYVGFYGDEDLWNVAKKLDLLWLNPEISHFHRHWSFGHMPRQAYHEKAQLTWEADQNLFFSRKLAEFPESGLLE